MTSRLLLRVAGVHDPATVPESASVRLHSTGIAIVVVSAFAIGGWTFALGRTPLTDRPAGWAVAVSVAIVLMLLVVAIDRAIVAKPHPRLEDFEAIDVAALDRAMRADAEAAAETESLWLDELADEEPDDAEVDPGERPRPRRAPPVAPAELAAQDTARRHWAKLMQRPTVPRRLQAFSGRLVIAFLFGLVISHGIEMAIFSGEIRDQVIEHEQEQVADDQVALDGRVESAEAQREADLEAAQEAAADAEKLVLRHARSGTRCGDTCKERRALEQDQNRKITEFSKPASERATFVEEQKDLDERRRLIDARDPSLFEQNKGIIADIRFLFDFLGGNLGAILIYVLVLLTLMAIDLSPAGIKLLGWHDAYDHARAKGELEEKLDAALGSLRQNAAKALERRGEMASAAANAKLESMRRAERRRVSEHEAALRDLELRVEHAKAEAAAATRAAALDQVRDEPAVREMAHEAAQAELLDVLAAEVAAREAARERGRALQEDVADAPAVHRAAAAGPDLDAAAPTWFSADEVGLGRVGFRRGPTPLEVGDLFPRPGSEEWRIEERLAHSGRSQSVWRVRHVDDGKKVGVLKVHDVPVNPDEPDVETRRRVEDRRERAEREMEILQRLPRGPLWPTVYDLQRDARADRLWSITRFEPDGTLEDWAAGRQRVSVEAAILFATDVLEAISNSNMRFIHCDLKPSNLLVARNAHDLQRLQLIDYELAIPVELAGTRRRLQPATVQYAAPETFVAGVPLDVRVDLYSLGGVLWFLGTGHAPGDLELGRDLHQVPRDERVRMLVALAKGRSLRDGSAYGLRDVVPDAPAGFADLVDDLLSFDPRQRAVSEDHEEAVGEIHQRLTAINLKLKGDATGRNAVIGRELVRDNLRLPGERRREPDAPDGRNGAPGRTASAAPSGRDDLPFRTTGTD